MAGIIGDITTSVSSSHPAVSRAGEGDFAVTGGGNKQSSYIALAAVAVTLILAAVAWSIWGRKRR